jgi:ABC-type nickel/cobalt efflux system permease component RcnA
MKRLKLAFVLLVFFGGSALFAQANPFQAGTPAPAPVAAPHQVGNPANHVVPFYVVWFSKLIDLQKDFQFGLTKAMRGVQADPWSAALWILILFSFLYGALHVLLPGHQKSVIGAYFLSENARYGQGFLVGALFSISHAVSVIIILVVLRVILQFTAGSSLNVAYQILQGTAVVGIVIVSFTLVARRLSRWREVSRLASLDKMRKKLAFDWHERLQTSYEPVPWKRLLPFLFFSAVLPCPGSLLVVLFAMGLGAPMLGVVSVLAMSVGMAFTLTVLSLVIIGMKRRGGNMVHTGKGRIFMLSVELLSLVAMMLFALMLWPSQLA